MILTVKKHIMEWRGDSFMRSATDFECFDEDGNKYRVDIFTDGGLPEGMTPESLIGRKIEVGFLTPYLEIANEVKLIEAPND